MLRILSGGFWKRLYLISDMTFLLSRILAGIPTRVHNSGGRYMFYRFYLISNSGWLTECILTP